MATGENRPPVSVASWVRAAGSEEACWSPTENTAAPAALAAAMASEMSARLAVSRPSERRMMFRCASRWKASDADLTASYIAVPLVVRTGPSRAASAAAWSADSGCRTTARPAKVTTPTNAAGGSDPTKLRAADSAAASGSPSIEVLVSIASTTSTCTCVSAMGVTETFGTAWPFSVTWKAGTLPAGKS